jgi:hypothetical protein
LIVGLAPEVKIEIAEKTEAKTEESCDSQMDEETDMSSRKVYVRELHSVMELGEMGN